MINDSQLKVHDLTSKADEFQELDDLSTFNYFLILDLAQPVYLFFHLSLYLYLSQYMLYKSL